MLGVDILLIITLIICNVLLFVEFSDAFTKVFFRIKPFSLTQDEDLKRIFEFELSKKRILHYHISYLFLRSLVFLIIPILFHNAPNLAKLLLLGGIYKGIESLDLFLGNNTFRLYISLYIIQFFLFHTAYFYNWFTGMKLKPFEISRTTKLKNSYLKVLNVLVYPKHCRKSLINHLFEIKTNLTNLPEDKFNDYINLYSYAHIKILDYFFEKYERRTIELVYKYQDSIRKSKYTSLTENMKPIKILEIYNKADARSQTHILISRLLQDFGYKQLKHHLDTIGNEVERRTEERENFNSSIRFVLDSDAKVYDAIVENIGRCIQTDRVKSLGVKLPEGSINDEKITNRLIGLKYFDNQNCNQIIRGRMIIHPSSNSKEFIHCGIVIENNSLSNFNSLFNP